METQNKLKFKVLNYITAIAKKAEASELSESNIGIVKTKITTLAVYLGVSKEQCILFVTVFVLEAKLYSIELRDIVNFLNLNFIDSVNIKNDIDVLLDKGLLEAEVEKTRRSRPGIKSNFSVNQNVSKAIYENKPLSVAKANVLDIYEFCIEVSDMISDRQENSITTSMLFSKVESLEARNNHLEVVTKLKAMKLDIDDRTLLYEMCDDMTTSGQFSSMVKTFSDIYDTARIRISKTKKIVERASDLFEFELINSSEGRFANDISLELTPTAMDILLGEDAILFSKGKKAKNVIGVDDIKSKQLYFEGKLREDIDFLTKTLVPEQYEAMKSRLEEQGMVPGINVLLHGHPGTGKTELCYQLSKQTGRDIVQVDLSQTRNMFFGESEKKVKEIFQNYNRLASKCELAPILLINEADGLLSKRRQNTTRSIDQTENTIQNILLEEIERFSGIMICTSNLVQNLDPAFDRRFLFKIKFEAPSASVKQLIWKNKLSWLDDTFVLELAEKFSFSGGQIENIAKKVSIHQVLNGTQPSNESIVDFCNSESMVLKALKVGYN